MFVFFRLHPELAIVFFSTLFFLATLAFAVVLLHFAGKLFLRLYAGYWQRRNERLTPAWPALKEKPLDHYTWLMSWAGWRQPPPLKYVVLMGAGFIILGALVGGVSGFVFMVLCEAVAYSVLTRRAQKQISLFIGQLPDALTSLVDTLRSGFSLPQAMDFIAREVTPPIQQTFSALVRAEALNITFVEALRRVAVQLKVPEWTIVAETLIAQQELGGNSIPLLEETAKALRDRLNVEQEIVTMTAAGRLSGFFIGGLVPIVLLFFFLLSPSYIGILLTTSIGRFLLLVALALEIIGFLWIRRITQIEY